jgi:hypothetical protein
MVLVNNLLLIFIICLVNKLNKIENDKFWPPKDISLKILKGSKVALGVQTLECLSGAEGS